MSHAHILRLTAPRTLAWHAEPLRPLARDDVLVRTLYGALSLGTELPLYKGTSRSPALTYPTVTGYETYGVVEAVGGAVERVRVGDRVVTFEGHATYAVVSAAKLICAPRALDPRLALLAILSNDVKRGILKLEPQPKERVLVTGAGAIGLLTLFMLKALGVSEVDVVEPRRERLELAHQLGAARTLTSEGLGAQPSYEIGVECSSRNAAFSLLQDAVRPGGRICILADGNVEPLVLTPQFHQKELQVVGSSDGEDYQGHARWFFGLPDLAKLTALFELSVRADELPATFAQLAAGTFHPVKVLVRYG